MNGKVQGGGAETSESHTKGWGEGGDHVFS